MNAKLLIGLLLSFQVLADLKSDWVSGCTFGLRSFATHENIKRDLDVFKQNEQYKSICEFNYNRTSKLHGENEKKHPVQTGCGFAIGAYHREYYGAEKTAKAFSDNAKFVEFLKKHCM